jgi:hypothetical protein
VEAKATDRAPHALHVPQDSNSRDVTRDSRNVRHGWTHSIQSHSSSFFLSAARWWPVASVGPNKNHNAIERSTMSTSTLSSIIYTTPRCDITYTHNEQPGDC